MISTQILTVVVAAGIFLFVIDLIRRERLTFKYAAFWIFVSGGAFLCATFDQAVFRIAAFFGFQLPSNFIFFTLLSSFVFLGLLVTIFLCQQNNRNDTMAQKIGMLELEIRKMKKRLDPPEKNGKDDVRYE